MTDFCDPWFEDIPEPGTPSGPVFRGIDCRLERMVIARCQRVMTSTVSLHDEFRNRYPREAPDKFTAILNGYDEADFTALPAATPPEPRLTIVHAGTINAEFRDPRPFFAAMQRVHQRRPGHARGARGPLHGRWGVCGGA